MLDRFRTTIGELGAGQPKKRQSTAGRGGGALQEALRARGGTKNLETVIAHQQAASDTEASGSTARMSRPAREPMPGRASSNLSMRGLPDSLRLPLPGSKPKAKTQSSRGSASSDDDLAGRSQETNLGWLDLQAFAPKALQQRLEKLMESAAQSDGEGRPQGGLAAAAERAKDVLSGLRLGGEPTSTQSQAGVLATPRGERAERGGAASSSGLRASLQRRGGVGEADGDGRDQEAVEFEASSQGALCEDVAIPVIAVNSLTSVPEDEVVVGVSPLRGVPPITGMPGLEAITLEDAEIERTDVSASEVPMSPKEGPSPDAAPSETTTCESSVPEPGDSSRVEPDSSAVEPDSPAVEPDSSAVELDSSALELDGPAVEPEASELSPEAPEALEALEEVPFTESQESEFEAVTEAPVPDAIATPADEVLCPGETGKIVRAASAPDATPAPTKAMAPVRTAPVVPQLNLRPAKEAWDDGATKFIESAAPPQAEAKVPSRPPVAQWCPGYVVDSKAKVAKAATDAAGLEEKSDEAKPTVNKFKDMREFWGKHSVGFAGPSLGAKGSISKGEAQAALQRLTQNAAACDPSEVRRLKKLIDM